MWGFQPQQQQPPMPQPTFQPLIHGQRMIPPPVMGNNFFQNQAPPAIIPNQPNLIPNQNAFPHIPPPGLPPMPNLNTGAPNPIGINLNRPPPPPPPQNAPPQLPMSGEGANRLGDNRNFNGPGRREGDWNCPQCQNHNFAWRKSCGRCNRDKNLDNPQFDAGWNEHNSNTGNSSSNNSQGHNTNRLQEAYDRTNQKPSAQEETFDIMFAEWEAGFESWKRENFNNPDQVNLFFASLVRLD